MQTPAVIHLSVLTALYPQELVYTCMCMYEQHIPVRQSRSRRINGHTTVTASPLLCANCRECLWELVYHDLRLYLRYIYMIYKSTLESRWIWIHRPSNKGTRLLFWIIKASIIINWDLDTQDTTNHALRDPVDEAVDTWRQPHHHSRLGCHIKPNNRPRQAHHGLICHGRDMQDTKSVIHQLWRDIISLVCHPCTHTASKVWSDPTYLHCWSKLRHSCRAPR